MATRIIWLANNIQVCIVMANSQNIFTEISKEYLLLLYVQFSNTFISRYFKCFFLFRMLFLIQRNTVDPINPGKFQDKTFTFAFTYMNYSNYPRALEVCCSLQLDKTSKITLFVSCYSEQVGNLLDSTRVCLVYPHCLVSSSNDKVQVQCMNCEESTWTFSQKLSVAL